MSIWDAEYPLIQEEASIQEHSDNDRPINYLVKAIDGGSERAQIKCQIDLDEWKNTLTAGYNSGSKTVLQIVQSVAPTGWAVVDQSGITYKRTVQLESATPLDVLEQCRSTFVNVTYRFDNVAKTVTIISMANGQNLGAFATRDLNLKENNYKGKSTGFITRLYAYGKDGLSFASINGGKAYVENYTYSSRVICGYWKDERYTVAANLLADAQARLAEMAVPARSFECNVVDLAAVNPQKYGFLDFTLFSVVSLIDATRSGAKIEHRVIERWRYPYLPEQNKVTLSTVAPRIQSQVAQAINNFNNPNSVWQQQQRSAQQNAIENATSQITGAKGGNMRAIYDSSGNWTELVVMNTEDILTASKLWRFNIGGFGYSPNGYNGPYTTAITMDGAIVADFITTGTLNAALAEVINLNASNITAGTLSAARIAAHSLAASKLTGKIENSDWGIDFDAGTFSIGTITAEHIDTKDLRVAAANITGVLTIGQLPSDVATDSDIPTKVSELTNDSGFQNATQVTTITNNTISTTNVLAQNLQVKAANISGLLKASQIEVGSGANLYPFYDSFEQATSSTLTYSKSANLSVGVVASSVARDGGKVMSCTTNADVSNSFLHIGHASTNYGQIRLSAGKYIASFYVVRVSGASTLSMRATVYGRSARSAVWSDSSLFKSYGGVTASVPTGLTWSTRVEIPFTVESGYPFVCLRLQFLTASASYYIDCVQIEPVDSLDQKAGAWHPAGTTVINGGNISAGTITANALAANSVTANAIAAGAITADKISVTDLSALGATIGGWEINQNNIRKLNPAGDLEFVINAPTSPSSNDYCLYSRVYDTASSTWYTKFGLTYGGQIYAEGQVFARAGSDIGGVGVNSSGVLSGIGTVNVSSGVSTSLGYADFSNGVFNNVNTASYIRATTAYITYIHATDTLWIGSARCYLGTVTINGVNYNVVRYYTS